MPPAADPFEHEENDLKVKGNQRTTRAKLAVFLSAEEEGVWFENAIMTLIFLNVLAFVLSTEKAVTEQEGADFFFTAFEAVSVLIFTVEYSLRLYAAPDTKDYRQYLPTKARVQHAISFFSLVDLIAIAPFWIDLLIPGSSLHATTFIRIIRILRLLKSKSQREAIGIFAKVVRDNHQLLVTTGVTALVLIVVFGSLLHFAEKDDVSSQEYHLTQADRFKSVPSGLWYTMVLLSGDYPLVDFTVYAKIICFFMLIIGTGLMGIPTGVFAAGYEDILREKKKAKHDEEDDEDEDDDPANLIEPQQCVNCQTTKAAEKGARAEWYIFLEGVTEYGRIFEGLIFILIIVNVFCFALSTEEAFVTKFTGPLFDVVEVFAVLVFTLEYLGRVWTCLENPSCPNRLSYMLSFLALIDFLAIAPFYIDIFIGTDFAAARVLRCFRMLRILKAETYMKSFSLLVDVFLNNAALLQASGYIAFIIWILAASLYYFLEKDNPEMDGAFESVPNALFYTAVFLGGEWARIDFSPAAKVMSAFLVVIGIAVYSVPVGILAAGFEDVTSDRAEWEEKVEGLKFQCINPGCSNEIENIEPKKD